MLFNPKEYYFWNKFTYILKKSIFEDKKFINLTKIYNITYKNYKNKKNNYKLNYPTKLKNFVSYDYYLPFLKPDLNFYNNVLSVSNPYLNKNFLNTTFDLYNLRKIQFEKFLPINYNLKPTIKIVCEHINIKGCIYGNIYFNHAFLLFISDNNSDPRNKNTNNIFDEELEEFYLYSYFQEERLKNKEKYIIMYYQDIEEIFIRRFCFNYVGYEIFMKDNRSYLFNFFNENNKKQFLQILSGKLEVLASEKKNQNNIKFYSKNKNILSLKTLNFNINNEINFKVINDPIYYFEKEGFKEKYQAGKINNFKYLLLINKYSSRTYKDITQYLIFPLLFMDISKKRIRDLSKAICLNKEEQEIDIDIMSYKENYSANGNHFNFHYSTSGFILYYLVRLSPFTFSHIKFQSSYFDVAERLFNSFNDYLFALKESRENRELIPELFCEYEPFINLNHNFLGCLDKTILINDLITNNENGIFEFVIKMRKLLEKSNIIPWVDNIFGYNQVSKNPDSFNIFPLSSYEQFNNFEEKKKKIEKGKTRKDIYKEIKESINLLNIGISPVQLFKDSHSTKNISTLKQSPFKQLEINNKLDKTFIIYKDFHNFIHSYMADKNQMFCISNENNNFEQKLIIKSKKNINLIKLYNNDKNNQIIKFELWKKKQIKIEPLSNNCCELFPGIYCFCRFIDGVIQIISEKQNFLYKCKCIITSIEFFSHNKIRKNTHNNNILYSNEIIFGDEKGTLSLLKIEYEFNNYNQEFSIIEDKIRIIKHNKAHNSFIQGILYVKRLNIIISYSEDEITINNAYSFNIINIIELGKNYYIKNIKISDYDLIYVYCYNYINKNNYIKCYSLNGINVTELNTNHLINNYFVNEKVIVVFENNYIEFYNPYNLSKNFSVINPKSEKSKNEEEKIIFSDYSQKNSSLIIIYQNLSTISINIPLNE